MFIPDTIKDIIVDYRMGLNQIITRNEIVKDMAKYYFNVRPMLKYFARWVEDIYTRLGIDNYERLLINDCDNFQEFLHSQKTDYWRWKADESRRRATVLMYPQFYDKDGYKRSL